MADVEALRDLRRASGLSGERLAQRCQLSQSKISRIETGRLLPSIVDVDRILTALAVDDAMKSDLLALARLANAEYQDVRASVRRGLHHRQRDLAAAESEATEMRHFLPAMITGLLQVPEYVRASPDRPVRAARSDTTRVAALKLERQAILLDETKHFAFLLTEQALRRPLCERSAKTIGNGPMSTFVTYDDRLVTLELFSGRLVPRDPNALWGDKAREFIAGVVS